MQLLGRVDEPEKPNWESGLIKLADRPAQNLHLDHSSRRDHSTRSRGAVDPHNDQTTIASNRSYGADYTDSFVRLCSDATSPRTRPTKMHRNAVMPVAGNLWSMMLLLYLRTKFNNNN